MEIQWKIMLIKTLKIIFFNEKEESISLIDLMEITPYFNGLSVRRNLSFWGILSLSMSFFWLFSNVEIQICVHKYDLFQWNKKT